MAKCEQCGKTTTFGQSRSKAFNTTKRKFKANLQRISIYKDGQRVRVMLCTKCIKTMAKS